jgi:autotransporter-associated beta strand protein
MTALFRSPNSLRTAIPVALSFLLSAASYAGVNYYYLDLNGSTSGFGSLNTSWDTTSPAWTLSTAGTTVPVPHTFTSDRIYISASGWDYDVAVFGAGSTRGVLTIANDLKIELFGLVDNVGQTIAASGGGYLYLRGSPPAGITVAAGVNSLISAPIVIGSSNDTKFNVNGTLSITGALSSNGTGDLIKDGTGTLILSGAGAYTGSFKVDRGTLRLTSQDAVSGSPYAISAGGALELQGGLSLGTVNTYSDGVASAGAIISLSGANQISTVNLTFSPNKISVAAGSVLTIGSIGGSTYDLSIGGAGNAVIASGVNVSILNKTGSGNLTFSQGGTSAAASAFNIQGGTVTATTSSLPSASISLSGGDLAIEQDFAGTISRQLSGTGRLIKSGTGVLTISRFDNSFSGGVVVNSGTLRSGAAGALPAASAVSVAAGATLDLNGYAATISALSGSGSVQLGSALLTLSPTSTQTFAGVISGSGSVSKPTGFDLYLNADNTFTGLLTIGGGKVVINRSIAADVLLSSSSATLFFNRDEDSTYGGAVSGTGVIYKNGFAKLTLTGSNTFTGDLTITLGTLEVSAAAPLGAGNVTLSRGTLATTGSFTSARPMTLATYPATSGTIDVLSGTELTWAGAISGGGSLVKTGAGTLTLSGTNTYTGTTTVSAGSLKLGSSSALAAGSQLVVAAGASIDYNGFSPSLAGVDLSPAGNETFPLSLSGAGSIKMNGSGALTLAAANTNTGGVVVNSGTLRSGAAGALPAASAVSVAAGATLDLNGYAATISALSGTGSVQLGSALLTLSPTSP